jgi:phage baseplate assembly protein gpV
MKKLISLFVVFCFVFTILPQSFEKADAADSARIIDVKQGNLLLDDGSLWVNNANGFIDSKLDVVAIAGNSSSYGYGLTRKGELVEWSYVSAPKLDASQTGIRQISDGFYVKTDGTVWSVDGNRQNGLDNVVLIAANKGNIASVHQDGAIKYTGYSKNLGKVQNPASIVALETTGDKDIAVLDNTGKLVLYDTFRFDMNSSSLDLIPETVTTNAAHISYSGAGKLLVTLKDGTVWQTGDYNDRFKLKTQVPGLEGVIKTSPLKDNSTFYFEQKDGGWKLYDKGQIKTVDVPGVSSLTFTVSDLNPYVGSSINAKIIEKYSNGSTKTIPLAQANITIQKPHLLKAMNDGTFKVLAVGETTITVTSGSATQTVKVSASAKQNLAGAKQINGTTYLPIQSVFKALGGTIVSTPATKTFDVKLGSTSISLKTGDSKARVDGKTVEMGGVVRADNGSTLFPASLLAKSLGATLKWDSKYKQMDISFGSAEMTVESAETAKVLKKEAQGSLSGYIGKSYWINHFEGWERFIKVTITDIVPEGSNAFTIIFKKANGQVIKSSLMEESYIKSSLSDDHFFLSYDPYKKYKWSSAIWAKVKAEKISYGMNKEQVRLSWGNPTSTSSLSASGITFETWSYGGYDYVTFTKGLVSDVYIS